MKREMKSKKPICNILMLTGLLLLTSVKVNGQLVASSSCAVHTLSPNGIEYMSKGTGLTVLVSPGCENVAWGFDGSSIVCDYGSNSGSTGGTMSTAFTVDRCQSNLERGLIVFTGRDYLPHYGAGGSTLDLRLTVKFSTNGTWPGNAVAISRNEDGSGNDIFFRSTGSAYRVHFLLEADASGLGAHIWNGGTTYGGWAPALDLFDALSTYTDAAVQTSTSMGYYKMAVITDAGIAPSSQSPTSLPNLAGGNNTGIELSAFNGNTGLTYTYTNPSATENLYVGFDAASGFGYSYRNPSGGSAADAFNDVGRILYVNTSNTNLATGLVYLYGCTPVRYVRNGAYYTDPSVSTRIDVRFQTAATWKDGIIYMTVPPGASRTINLRMYANANELLGTVVWNGTAMSGWVPALSMFDNLNTQPNSTEYSQAHQKAGIKTFYESDIDNTATVTWTANYASDRTDWHQPCNWDCRVPTITDEVIIPDVPDGGSFYPEVRGTDAYCKNADIQGVNATMSDRLKVNGTGELIVDD